jgi:hypothetical protein
MGIFALYTSDACPALKLRIVECPPLAWRPAPSIRRRIGPGTIEPTVALRASVRRHRSGQRDSPMLRSITRASPCNPTSARSSIGTTSSKEARKEWYRIVPMLDKMGVLGNVDAAALIV